MQSGDGGPLVAIGFMPAGCICSRLCYVNVPLRLAVGYMPAGCICSRLCYLGVPLRLAYQPEVIYISVRLRYFEVPEAVAGLPVMLLHKATVSWVLLLLLMLMLLLADCIRMWQGTMHMHHPVLYHPGLSCCAEA